jgi:predicted RNA-binding protein YlqC (UPF0109 family)
MIEVVRLKRGKMEEKDFSPLEDKELLLEILQALVSKPENLRIDEQTNGTDLTILVIHAHDDDKGKILGKQGMMIKSIQQIFRGIGYNEGRKIMIQLGNQGRMFQKNQPSMKRSRKPNPRFHPVV